MSILDPVTLEVFKHLILAIPEEMGANLRRTAFSPNIKERLDESCALIRREAVDGGKKDDQRLKGL